MGERTIVGGRRFRGPDLGGGTGNGGYFCGLVALAAGPGARAVEIRRASGVPVDRPLRVRVVDDSAEVYDDEGLIARRVRRSWRSRCRRRRRSRLLGGLRGGSWSSSRAGRSRIPFRSVSYAAIDGSRA